MVGGSAFGRPQHALLHICGITYCHHTSTEQPSGDSHLMFEVQPTDMPGATSKNVSVGAHSLLNITGGTIETRSMKLMMNLARKFQLMKIVKA